MLDVTRGTNLGFAANRFLEPKVWARLVAEELRLHSVQWVVNLLNRFWPLAVLDAEIDRTLEAVDRYNIVIDSLMTSTYTRVNHCLHPCVEMCNAWPDWSRRFADLVALSGAKAVGSYFGILSCRDVADPTPIASDAKPEQGLCLA